MGIFFYFWGYWAAVALQFKAMLTKAALASASSCGCCCLSVFWSLWNVAADKVCLRRRRSNESNGLASVTTVSHISSSLPVIKYSGNEVTDYQGKVKLVLQLTIEHWSNKTIILKNLDICFSRSNKKKLFCGFKLWLKITLLFHKDRKLNKSFCAAAAALTHSHTLMF